jgi:hypothetical protein
MEKKPNLHGKKVRHGLAWSAKGKKSNNRIGKKRNSHGLSDGDGLQILDVEGLFLKGIT